MRVLTNRFLIGTCVYSYLPNPSPSRLKVCSISSVWNVAEEDTNACLYNHHHLCSFYLCNLSPSCGVYDPASQAGTIKKSWEVIPWNQRTSKIGEKEMSNRNKYIVKRIIAT